MARVLVVDDSAIMRRNLKNLLNEANHTVVGEAKNGKEAYLEYKVNKPDLVTMDISMPIMDGIAAVEEIIADFPKAKIIIISALDQRSKVFEALEKGAKHYIIKPITVDKVTKIVEKVLADESEPEKGNSKTESSAEAQIAETTEPFTINNSNGKFIINIQEEFNELQCADLERAVNGFLYVKPLQIIFDFGAVDSLPKAVIDKLEEIVIRVQEAGGSIEAVASNQEFKQLVEETNNVQLTEIMEVTE